MSRHVLLLVFMSVAILFGGSAPAEIDTISAREELERIENMRLLHRCTVQDLHDAKALAMYLRGWEGPDRMGEVETLFQEAEDLYGVLRGVDKGAQALLAQLRAGDPAPSAQQFDLVERARRFAAGQVNRFYANAAGLNKELAQQINQAAAGKIKWQVTSRPEPWADPAREADRQASLPRGIALHEEWFFDQPEDETNYFLDKCVKTGITYANVLWSPACNWGDIEREPGNYDFAALDEMIARFAKYKMRVCPMLRSLTGTPPPWHAAKFGKECMLYTAPADRRRNKDAEARGINLFHPPTGEAFLKFLTAYSAHLEQKWPDQIDAVFMEGDQREIEAPVHQSQAMDAYWRKWSKTDTPWRTPEAILENEQPDEAAAARAEMCREAWLLEYIRRARNALKEGWPGLRVQNTTASDDFHRLFAAHTGKSRDAYSLAQLTDNPCVGTSSAASFRLFNSFANGRWLWGYALHSGSGATAGADCAQAPFQDVARITINSFGRLTRTNYPMGWYRLRDGQLGDFGIGSYFLVPRRCQEIAPIALNTRRPQADVAILWSQATRRRDPSSANFKSEIAWGHMLNRVFVNFDYVPAGAGDALAERLARYRVLILPNTQSMTDHTNTCIRNWVEQGGTVLGFGAPGLFDEYGSRRPSLPLADVFGADVARLRVPGPITPDDLQTTHPEGCFLRPPPHPYKFEASIYAALELAGGKPRAWFAGTAKEAAIVENTFGRGKAMLCGFPVGFEYWESARYELGYGLTHFRQANYNHEQKRYEAWAAAELAKYGITREVTLPEGSILRGQRGDDPDWGHIYRNNPIYHGFMFERDRPVRTVYAFHRKRDGIDNTYIGLCHTEGNYSTGRGYFRHTLIGARVTVSVAVEGDSPVAFDARLRVPVPWSSRQGERSFTAWVPLAQPAAFALAPAGNVRLFGPAKPTGIGSEELARITADYAAGTGLGQIEILDRDRIAAFLDEHKGGKLVIACGDTRFRPAAQALADWLKDTRQIDSRITTEGPRVSCTKPYMDGWGWPGLGGDPVKAAVLIGNCQDNPLMWRFVLTSGSSQWLPFEINQNFPGIDRAIVMLSSPVLTNSDGVPHTTKPRQQLVIGASFPSEALRAVKALQEKAR